MGLQRAELAHLFRRAGFGARPGELDAAEGVGYEATVEALVYPAGGTADAGAAATPPPDLGPEPPLLPLGASPAEQGRYGAARWDEARRIIRWWLARMAAVEHPVTEKLTFFWHGHWATSLKGVPSARLMLRQNQTLRSRGGGDFRDLARAMVRDPALLVWLDGPLNNKANPNENLSRELMELFILGIGNYTEDDVREAARALTGWRVSYRTGSVWRHVADHDNRSKTVLGRTAAFDDQSLVDLLVETPASARFAISRLWFRFVSPNPPPAAAIARLLSAYGPGRDIRALLRAMLLEPDFRSARSRHALVKQPIEYVVGALRALHAGPGAQAGVLLGGLGQLPFLPPSVGGWPSGSAWLTTSAAQIRLQFAGWLVQTSDLSTVEQEPPATRVDAVARLLSVEWTPRTRAALTRVSADTAQLVTLALVSPEYVIN